MTSTSLKALNDLGYVVECVAGGYFSDAKPALDSLCNQLACDPAYRVHEQEFVLASLNYALSCLRGDGDRREGVEIICKIHRKLWSYVDGA